jgi:choline dehydrogenase-like flavoprotein
MRVHRLDGLQLINASVLPAATSTNTNAPTVMTAANAAAMVKGAAHQRLAAQPRTLISLRALPYPLVREGIARVSGNSG